MKQLYLLALLFSLYANAQSFEWIVTPETSVDINPDMIGYATAGDADGNIYFAGFKDTPYPYNDIKGNLFYNKYNSAGQLLFSNTFTGKGSVYKIVADNSGNSYVALNYLNSLTVSGTTFTSSSQGEQWVLLKLNSQGSLIWYRELDTDVPEWNEIADFRAMALDAMGNLYIGYDTYLNSYIIKLSPAGVEMLTIEQENVSRITSVSVDTDGNIIAAGSCANQDAIYAGVSVGNSLLYNTYIVKYSPMGQYQWVKYVEDITCPEPQVVTHNANEIYFSSHLFGDYQFDGITAEGPLQGFSDFFIAKLDASGNFQWVKEVPGQGMVTPGNRNFLSIDSSGNIYFTGQTAGTIQWGNNITTGSQNFNYRGIVLKYNPSGNIVMAKTIMGNSYSQFGSIHVNPDNSIYTTGIGMGTLTFDAIQHVPQNANYYPFLTKISGNSTLGTESEGAGELTVYPNPATNVLYVNSEKEIEATIYNTLGQKLKTVMISRESPVFIEDLAQGSYFIQFADNYTAKIIKQ
jgi:hypothetical protein